MLLWMLFPQCQASLWICPWQGLSLWFPELDNETKLSKQQLKADRWASGSESLNGDHSRHLPWQRLPCLWGHAVGGAEWECGQSTLGIVLGQRQGGR